MTGSRLKSLVQPLISSSNKRSRSGSGGSGDYQPHKKINNIAKGLRRRISGGNSVRSNSESDKENLTTRNVDFKYTWPVEGVVGQTKTIIHDGHDSKAFKVNFNGISTVWNLSVRFWDNDDGERLPSQLVLCLNLMSLKDVGDCKDNLGVKFTYGVYNRVSGEYDMGHTEKTFLDLIERDKLFCVGYKNINIEKDHTNNKGDVIFQVRMSLTGVCGERKPSYTSPTEHQYIQYNKLPTDGVLQAGERKFPVHQETLIEKSSVLAELFRKREALEVKTISDGHNLECPHEDDKLKTNNEKKEKVVIDKTENKIVVIDLAPDLTEKLLNFIYTNKVKNLSDHWKIMIELADKFQIPDLYDLCCKHLMDQLDVVNVPDILLVSDRYNCDQLKKSALSFCSKNISYIIKNSGWTKMESDNPELWEEVMTEVAPVTCHHHHHCIKEACTRYMMENNIEDSRDVIEVSNLI